jgi:multiple sugar transport system substrate-binding protein
MNRSCLLTVALLLSVQLTNAKTSLTWLDYFTSFPAFAKTMDDLFQQYQKDHPDVEIKRETVPFGELKNRVIQGAATHTAPDIVVIDCFDHAGLASQGVFADLSEKVQQSDLKDAFFKHAVDSTIYQGKTFGLPFVSNSTALWYNEDLLKQAGIAEPPKTWEQLRADAKQLSKPPLYGFALSLVATDEGNFTYLPFLWSAGGDVDHLDSAASVRALNFVKQLVVDDRSVSRSAISWSQQDVMNVWLAGRAAMMINGPWNLPNVRAANPTFKWQIASWPQDKEFAPPLGGENIAFGAGSHVDAAWQLVSWLEAPERLKQILIALGDLPPRKDMSNDPYWAKNPLYAPFLKAVESARVVNDPGNYQKYSPIVIKLYQSVLTGQATPEQAAETAAKSVAGFSAANR